MPQLINALPQRLAGFTASYGMPGTSTDGNDVLAVGATWKEVVPDADGQVVVRPIMHITLAADPRVVDGAAAAHFSADLKAALEAPVLLPMKRRPRL